MKSSLRIAIVSGLLVAAAAPVSGQSAAPPLPRFKTEIVVTPERGDTPKELVPASSSVLSLEQIKALPAVTIAEACSFLPGFEFRQEPLHSGRPVVSSRGFFGGGEAEYVLLLVDGVPMSDSESGLADWSAVPLASAERVEALRGPASALYGDTSVGGVIQVFTRKTVPYARLLGTGGSFATVAADGSVARRFGAVDLLLNGMGARTDGAFEHSEAHQASGGVSLSTAPGASRWRVRAMLNDRAREDPGPRTLAELEVDPYGSSELFRFDNMDRRGGVASVQFGTRTGALDVQARGHVSGRSEDGVRTVLLAPSLPDRWDRLIDTTSVGGSVDLSATPERLGLRHDIRFGAEVSRDGVETDYKSVSETGQIGPSEATAVASRLRSAAFASDAIALGKRTRLLAGVRFDAIGDSLADTDGQTLTAWSPRVGLTVLAGPDDSPATVYLQVSRAFKAPTLDQLFDPRPYPDFTGGTFSISNPDLRPQRATNLEAGASGGRALRWNAAAYWMAVKDEIDFDVRTFSYGNIGDSRHKGVELGAQLENRVVRPSVNYSWSRVTAEGADHQLKNIPPHSLVAAAAFNLPRAVSVTGVYRRLWGGYLDDDNTFPLDGRSTIDARVRVPFGRIAALVDVWNLTGNHYEEYGFVLSDFFGQPTGYAYPGAGRALRVGVDFTF